MIALADGYRWLDDDGPAFGGPGLEPRWTSSRKDAVVTAYAASSRVWFTASHGTLNEIYYPTIDRPQTRDMEFLFSDGETFFHEEKRDFEYDFHYIDPDAPAIRVVGHDPEGRYVVTKEFITDPHHPVVLVHVAFTGDEDVLSRLKCYALLSPHLNGGGAGNSARSIEVAGQRAILAWRDSYSLAMGVSCGFSRSSCGYVGTSDGYQDLMGNRRMDWHFGQALDGNVAVMGEIDVARTREFTVAIAFGEGHHAALAGMMQTLATPYATHCKKFIEQWLRAKSPQTLAAASTDGGRLARISHDIILTHEDKTYSGAFIASASIPWGASKSDDDLGGYHLVWTRDMVQSATAMIATGRTDTALRALVYLACTQRPDGSFAQNFWIDGTPYWSGIQLDEVAFPIILAWRLWKLGGLGNFDVFSFVEGAAAYLVKYAPITQQERWEENAGYSPSTLAAVISGLLCAADIIRAHQEDGTHQAGAREAAAGESAGEVGALADFLESHADWLEANLDAWTTTTEGVLDPAVKVHYMRIRPPAVGELFHNNQVAPGSIHLSNRGAGERADFEAREVIDAGFLELVRYGIRRADDPLIVDSLRVVDAVLKIDTPFGACWRRYNHDGYGQKKDGGPYEGWGQGRAWPLLAGERAHYELAAGRDVKPFIRSFEQFSSVGGMLPEQVWDHADMPEEGMFLGKSAGSAQPLVWAHSEYIKLLRSVADGAVFDRIPVVAERYAVATEQRTFRNQVEIFRAARPVSEMVAGLTLRIVDALGYCGMLPGEFEAVWSADGWATTQRTVSVRVGSIGWFVDIPTSEEQRGAIVFTMHWMAEDRWLGRDVVVTLLEAQEKAAPAGVKPAS